MGGIFDECFIFSLCGNGIHLCFLKLLVSVLSSVFCCERCLCFRIWLLEVFEDMDG